MQPWLQPATHRTVRRPSPFNMSSLVILWYRMGIFLSFRPECGGCTLWQRLPGHSLVNRIARRVTPPAGCKAVTFIIGRGEWEFQKWPLWTPNDSCGGCALWQRLPGHSLVNRIARRVTPPAGCKAVTFIIGRGDGNSKSGLYGRPMIHVGAAPYGRAFPAPPLRASSHGGSWKALPHGFAGLHTFPLGDLGHFGVV